MKRMIRSVARQALIATGQILGENCPICGKNSFVVGNTSLPLTLIETWNISPLWQRRFAEREFRHCLNCGCSVRVRQFAQQIVAEWNRKLKTHFKTLNDATASELVGMFEIAEINSLGAMHRFLGRLPKLKFSEYGSTDLGIPHQDLSHLTYPSDSFDYVYTSETLEHVPDFSQALFEIHRVLKPGGKHLFTIPYICDRPKTVKRSELRDGKLVHLLPPSYHTGPTAESADYLVFSEFGADVVQNIRACGFDVELSEGDNPAVVTFITTKL